MYKFFKAGLSLVCVVSLITQLKAAEDTNPSKKWLTDHAKHMSWEYYRKPYNENVKVPELCGQEHNALRGAIISISEDNMSWLQEYIDKGWTSRPTDITQHKHDHRVDLYVRRPNHSLGHANTVEFTTVDIVTALNSPATDVLTHESGIGLRNWVRNKMSQDPHFKKKVSFLASYVKSGRRSEISERGNGATCQKCYDQYKRYDAQNFEKVVRSKQPKLFTDAEIETYKKSFLPTKDLGGKISEDTKYMKRILDGGHNADLRRLYEFPALVAHGLFGENNYGHQEYLFCLKLWDRAAKYIEARGEKFVKSDKIHAGNSNMIWDGDWHFDKNGFIRGKYTKDFAIQHYRPELMIEALLKAREEMDKDPNFQF